MGRLVSFCVAVTLAAGGCTMAPTYVRPAAPVPPQWPVDSVASAASTSAPTRWQEFFTDPKLSAVIELAVSSNRDLRTAALAVERTQALYRIQRSQLLPTVGVMASGQKLRIPAEGAREAETVTQYSADLGVAAWELDLFGRIRSLSASALEQYLATRHARRAAQVSLVAAIASEYIALAADREALALAQATLEAQQESLGLQRRSRELGIASDLELRQVETQVESARAAVAAFAGAVAVDRHTLDLLAGAPVPADLLPERLGISMAQAPAAGLPSEVLLQRPDVLAAEHRLRAANASIGAARAAFFPRISLTAALGTTSGELGGLFGAGSAAWTFVPQLTAPLWSAGYHSANLKVAKVDREIAVALYEKAIQVAFSEVSNGLALRGTLLQQRQAQEALVDALSETHRLSDARYRAGIDGYLAVLVAQRALFSGQQALIGVRLAEQLNLVSLYKVLGGGA